MKKLLILAAVASALFAGGGALTGGVKSSGEIVLDNEYEKSAQIFKRSCSQGHMLNCYNLGKFYAEGKGVIKSEANAEKYYKMSCDGGVSFGCFELGKLAHSKGDDKAFMHFLKSCDLENDEGCYEVAQSYGKGVGIDKNTEKANEFLKKACTLAHDKACKEKF